MLQRPKKTVIQEMVNTPTAPVKRPGKDGLKQMSYYITEDMIKAIAIRAAYSGQDKSAVVRKALEEYLAKELDDLA